MTERIQRLRATLAELETELRELPAVDIQTRAVLEAAVAEITTVLQRSGDASAASASTMPSTAVHARPVGSSGSWRETVADFEVSHPQIAGLLSRVINSLAQIGI